MKKLPTKLEKQTVLDAISEISFKDTKDIAVLFSNVYSILKEHEWEYQKLPVMDIPENIRKENQSFERTPHYVFVHEGKRIFIGPRIMAFAYDTSRAYKGWSNYRKDLSQFYDLLKNVNNETNISEVSLNFIDFFKEVDIFEHSTVSVVDNALQNIYKDVDMKKQYATDLSVEGLDIKIKIENELSLMIKGTETEIDGSMIDINISKLIDDGDALSVYDEMHKHSKNIFFNLLKEDFIQTLKPTYEE